MNILVPIWLSENIIGVSACSDDLADVDVTTIFGPDPVSSANSSGLDSTDFDVLQVQESNADLRVFTRVLDVVAFDFDVTTFVISLTDVHFSVTSRVI